MEKEIMDIEKEILSFSASESNGLNNERAKMIESFNVISFLN